MCTHEQGRGKERGRERIPSKAPWSAWIPTRGSVSWPWNHDLTQNQESDAQQSVPPRHSRKILLWWDFKVPTHSIFQSAPWGPLDSDAIAERWPQVHLSTTLDLIAMVRARQRGTQEQGPGSILICKQKMELGRSAQAHIGVGFRSITVIDPGTARLDT